ncbi:class C beta-lactamase [Pararhizobium gei]|uniref:class C beta-lactamase n=1 Tax=Pararhizobium gei TaxID=1395951 RepID=UPI0023DA5789|nr:class C beta-lactamase [Rhizobium gei]
MKNILSMSLFLAALPLAGAAYAEDSGAALAKVVEQAVVPLMKEHNIPGMAVAVTIDGERHFFNFGLASKESGQKVSEKTIFEIGSISKTFSATVAAYAQVQGKLSFDDKASQSMPSLKGSSFDRISLLELGTYTAGGLPLQFPDEVGNEKEMINYFSNWRLDFDPGTHRRYSNPSIGLFGHLAAQSLGKPMKELLQKEIFPAFGLSHTYVTVPKSEMSHYAYGYNKKNKPVRVTPGMLDIEAYGVKTTSADLIRFVEANIDSSELPDPIKRAVDLTQTGYYRVNGMTQGLGWEIYPYPADMDVLLAGNSQDMALKPHRVEKLEPPLPPQSDVLINKTGSTGGFGAYAAFVPAKRIGIVMLANTPYPNTERVRAAYSILRSLDESH